MSITQDMLAALPLIALLAAFGAWALRPPIPPWEERGRLLYDGIKAVRSGDIEGRRAAIDAWGRAWRLMPRDPVPGHLALAAAMRPAHAWLTVDEFVLVDRIARAHHDIPHSRLGRVRLRLAWLETDEGRAAQWVELARHEFILAANDARRYGLPDRATSVVVALDGVLAPGVPGVRGRLEDAFAHPAGAPGGGG